MTAAQPTSGDHSLPSPATALLQTDTANTISGGTLNGPSVQAGRITGGIHFHAAASSAPPVPRQILPLPAAFTDRVDDVQRLTDRLEHMPAGSVRIAVISGPSGIGKSALATRLLHELGDRFPGGQLYADLRGYAPEGWAPPAEILGRFLRALRPDAQPAAVEEMAAWWRSVTAEQPMGIVLDNVVDADHLRALLPGGRGHVLVATSRGRLASLAGDGAVLHRLGPLDPAAALEYLTFCLGEDRIRREPAAADEIAVLCAGLPMALALAVTELSAHPGHSLAEMATTLSGNHRLLRRSRPLLNRQEAAVSAALDHAYAALPGDTPTALVYRRLGSLFVLDVDAALTAAVCHLTHEEAAEHLRLLRAAHLLEPAPGHEHPVRGDVYRFHDAARVHARGRAQAEAAAGELDDVLRRALDFFLANTTTVEHIVTQTHRLLARDYAHPLAHPLAFDGEETALAWLVAQRDNLFAAIRAAHAGGLDTSVYQLAHALWPLLRATHDYPLWFESHSLGLQAARRCGDWVAERELLGTWAVGLRGAGRFDQAAQAFTEVLSLARAGQDLRAEAQALHELGSVALETDRLEEAESRLLEAKALRVALSRTGQEQRDRVTFQRSVAITDVCLGQVLLKAGRPSEAVETLASARRTLLDVRDPLDAGRDLDIRDPLDAGRALAWLARAYAEAGDLTAGEEQGRHAVAEFDQLDVTRWRARSRELLGHTLRAAAKRDEARAKYREAIKLYERVSRRDVRRVQQALSRAS